MVQLWKARCRFCTPSRWVRPKQGSVHVPSFRRYPLPQPEAFGSFDSTVPEDDPARRFPHRHGTPFAIWTRTEHSDTEESILCKRTSNKPSRNCNWVIPSATPCRGTDSNSTAVTHHSRPVHDNSSLIKTTSLNNQGFVVLFRPIRSFSAAFRSRRELRADILQSDGPGWSLQGKSSPSSSKSNRSTQIREIRKKWLTWILIISGSGGITTVSNCSSLGKAFPPTCFSCPCCNKKRKPSSY